MKLLERASHKKRANHKKGVTKPMAHPTPIQISKRTTLVVALAILATLMLVLWAVPSVLISVVGGFGLIWENLSGSAKDIAGSVLGGTFGVVSGTFSFALSLFGIVFVAAYMLIDVRRFKTTYLLAVPAHYRRDARDLWNAFGLTLSRYLNGLALDLAIQGAISAVALYLIGVPYALVLGAFVSLTALIPYIGAWLGAVPAVIVAFTVSPTAVILTVIVFVVIQQLEGNFLMPKIQGQSLHVHPVLVFLAVIIGGGLAGLVGVLLAVPTLAVLRVLFDFFRARLRTRE